MTAMRNAFRVGLVLWAGSLWSLALWVTPTLFFAQSDRRLAGMLAGRMFSVETWLGVGVAAAALLQTGRFKFFWLYLAAAVLAVNEWGLRRLLQLAHEAGRAWGLSFGAWHGVSAGLYGIACLATLGLIWKNDLR
jgi:hypothetical protein